MDKHTLNNWKLLKEQLERSGKTESMFYKRAVRILEGKRDPFA